MTASAARWGEPWVVHEDGHVLVVAKPAGVNTHRADVGAQDGMYEWVQRQRPDVALSVVHRLDKETSGVLVFGKSADANRALARQFEGRTVDKVYDLVSSADGGGPAYQRCDDPIAGATASTSFTRTGARGRMSRYEARPHSGRTHQVRIHASALGHPILGDPAHGGDAAARVHLHASSIAFEHPVAGHQVHGVPSPASFDRPLADDCDPIGVGTRLAVAHEARATLFDPADTDAYLWADRHHDEFADLRIERLGRVALVLDYRGGEDVERTMVDALHETLDLDGVWVQRRPRGGGGGPAQRVSGAAEPRFPVSELGVTYRIDLDASATSSGLFLDQRETRRELLGADLAGTTVLNAFAHTGALSVAAALAGAETLTLDLSRHYLDWARDNLRANELDPDEHDFIYGDALDWMARLVKKGRRFDTVLVDPPTSSTTRRGSKRWRVARDLSHLVSLAAQLCTPGGTLYVSTNFRKMTWAAFSDQVASGLSAAGRSGRIDGRTLPLDHRSGAGDPPYLKAAWIRMDD